MIATLEFRALSRVLRDRDEIEKIFLIKKELYASFLKLPEKLKTIITKHENPEISITTQFGQIHPKSSLARLKERLQPINTQGVWKRGKDQYDATMIAFAFKPETDNEKEKK